MRNVMNMRVAKLRLRLTRRAVPARTPPPSRQITFYRHKAEFLPTMPGLAQVGVRKTCVAAACVYIKLLYLAYPADFVNIRVKVCRKSNCYRYTLGLNNGNCRICRVRLGGWSGITFVPNSLCLTGITNARLALRADGLFVTRFRTSWDGGFSRTRGFGTTTNGGLSL